MVLVWNTYQKSLLKPVVDDFCLWEHFLINQNLKPLSISDADQEGFIMATKYIILNISYEIFRGYWKHYAYRAKLRDIDPIPMCNKSLQARSPIVIYKLF